MFNQNCCNQVMPSCPREIVEPVVNKCIEKCCYHEVSHICPIHTHVINKHIYNHTYRPCYTCSEECQMINNECGSCCQF